MNGRRAWRCWSGAKADLAVVVAAVVVYALLATQFEFFEKIVGLTRGYEHWQLDEWPLVALVLAIGMCWFSWRRAKVARRALEAQVKAEQTAQALLDENRQLAQALIKVQDAERKALARELHDEFGQHCTAMRTDASFIQHASQDDGIVESANRIAQSASRLNGLVRDMLDRLRPPELDSLGLQDALQTLCEQWEAQTDVACVLTSQGLDHDLDDEHAVTLYRLVQEALTNVARHADATHVHIALAASVDAVNLTVTDDGKGFSGDRDLTRHGYGLVGMRERVAALDGQIQFSQPLGVGSRIDVTLPLPPSLEIHP